MLNPTLDADRISAAKDEDPESHGSEYGGLFRSNTSEYVRDELIDFAIVPDRTELPFRSNVAFHAFVDVSGGMNDSSALAIAHREPGTRAEHVVLDQLHVEKAPHSPHEVVAKFSAILQRFQIRYVVGDRYSGQFVVDAFRHTGIRYEQSELAKSEIYAEVAPLFAEKRIELLDDKKLITELRLLERRPRAGGRADVIDHAPGAHDDAINACAGALWLAAKAPVRPMGARSRPEFSIM